MWYNIQDTALGFKYSDWLALTSVISGLLVLLTESPLQIKKRKHMQCPTIDYCSEEIQ